MKIASCRGLIGLRVDQHAQGGLKIEETVYLSKLIEMFKGRGGRKRK